jgi:hypothetical protein
MVFERASLIYLSIDRDWLFLTGPLDYHPYLLLFTEIRKETLFADCCSTIEPKEWKMSYTLVTFILLVTYYYSGQIYACGS